MKVLFMISNLETKSSKRLSKELSDIFNNTIHEIEFLANQAPNQIVEFVHLIRKRLKFLRAFVKLTRFCTDEENYKPINYLLRDCGRTISDCRDAHVRGLLLTEFTKNSSMKILIERLSDINNSTIEEIEKDLLSGTTIFDKLIDELSNIQIRQYFESMKPNNKCLISGLSLGYEKSYTAYHSELKSHEADLLHEWRKRTKDLQYQLEALLESMPDQLPPSYDDVAALCEILGRINDLFMFMEWLHSVEDSIKEGKKLKKLRKKLKKELKTLEDQADKMGHSLFKLSPEEFSAELSSRLEL